MEAAILVILILNLIVSVLNILAASRHEKLASFIVAEIQAGKQRAATARQNQLQ